MDLSEARRRLTERMLPGLEFFQELAEQGLIHGDGKALAHGINSMCLELLEGRWNKRNLKHRGS